ncbi:MAG: Fpg/Nei family glycosylase [Sphingobacteriaceae bacterium]|jgi:formamidopyrimidine-DNA glycosylase|nr:Fpg/Nei family glycosylase [Sphingobacteriaceae bacterium]
MPELPDLQVFARNLKKLIAGKSVTRIELHKAKNSNVALKELKGVEKQALKKIYRDGKELFLEFEKGDVLAFHMMLHGKLYYSEKAEQEKNTIAELRFDDGSSLSLTDFQGIANIKLNPDKKPGMDALSKNLDFDFLKNRLEKTRTNIKAVLMDQKIISGIGNAYADEILWDAGIAPNSAANKIPDEKIKDLATSIKKVLEEAEENILKAKPDIIAGEVRDFLKIHNSHLQKSPGGAAIKVEVKGGRKTYYTDEQELYK